MGISDRTFGMSLSLSAWKAGTYTSILVANVYKLTWNSIMCVAVACLVIGHPGPAFRGLKKVAREDVEL